MRFTSRNLIECAYERLAQALAILDDDPTAGAPLAAYLSGVAVECAIRAKRKIVSDEINAGHRLLKLANEADYASRLKGTAREDFDADLNEMMRLWGNLLRYCSATAYIEFLVRRGAEVSSPMGTIKASLARRAFGDAQTARLAAEDTYDRAQRIVRYGESFWERRR